MKNTVQQNNLIAEKLHILRHSLDQTSGLYSGACWLFGRGAIATAGTLYGSRSRKREIVAWRELDAPAPRLKEGNDE